MQKSLSTAAVLTLVSALLLTLALFVSGLGPIGKPESLVSAAGWKVTGDLPRMNSPVPDLQIPREMQSVPGFGLWRTWTQTGTVKGTISSPPFRAPEYLAVPFLIGGFRGYPDSDRVVLRCPALESELTVASGQSFDEWNVAYVSIPEGFCASTVQVVGISNAADPGAYVGVGTPFSVSRAIYLAHAGFGLKAVTVVGTWLLFALVFLAGAFAGRGRIDSFGAGAIAVGVAGMIVFVGGEISSAGARIVATGCIIVAIVVVAYAAIANRSVAAGVMRKVRIPLVAWLALAMCLIAFMSGADSQGGRWAANAIFAPLSWSTDNQNTVLFAQQFAHRAPGFSMQAGPWFFDDRTPLLTVMLVIPQTLIAEPLAHLFGSDLTYYFNSVSAITILSFWIAVLLWFSTKITVRRPGFFFAIVATSPFLLFNTVYTWGKLLGAVYLLLAIGLMMEDRQRTEDRSNFGLIPVALTLSYLSHAGNAIGAVTFLMVFWTTLRWRDAKTLSFGAAGALLIMLPWAYWAHVIQPGGNALSRFQLANDYGFGDRSASVLSSTIDYLRSIGVHGWIDMKLRWFAWLINVNGHMPLGAPVETHTGDSWANQRALDFVVVSRTIGIATIGVLGAVWCRFVRGEYRDWLAMRLIACGALGLAIMTMLIVQVGITHDHSYGSILMLSVAGAMFLADRDSRWAVLLFSAWLIYFAFVWVLQPLANADHVHSLPLIAAGAWALALGWACKLNASQSGSR